MIEVARLSRWPSAAAVASMLLLLAVSACSRPSSTGGYPDFADLVERASPSVVNISTISAGRSAAAQAPGAGETPPDTQNAPEWFRRFLEQNGGSDTPDNSTDADPGDLPPGDGVDEGEAAPGAPQPLGSGFILWEDGYILTNYHVVRDAKEVIVKLSDRRQYVGKLAGYDERSDLALLQIDAKGLPAVKLGDSNKLRPGQWVLAIGAPFGFDYSVTAGIVSAKGRALDTEQYVPFIQTDVAINPGNSGGPLFNVDGEVVGINSQIYSQSGGYQGVSFAIPSSIAEKVARQLKDKGKVTRGWLGVVVQPVTRELAQQLNMERPEGALISRVMPGSPSEQAGLRAGDVITKFDGEVLPSSRELPPLVGSAEPAKMVTLTLLRDGHEVTIKAQVGMLDNQDLDLSAAAETDVQGGPLAVTVRPLTADDRKQTKTPSGGVLAINVQPGPAASAGVRAGDVILQVSGQEVDSVQRFNEVVGRLAPGQNVPLLIQRKGSPVFLSMNMPAKTESK